MPILEWQDVHGAQKYAAVLEARSSDKTDSDIKLSVCIVFNSQYQSLPSGAKNVYYHHLVDLTHVEGCSVNDFNTSEVLESKVVAVARGGCTFIQKARMVDRFNGAAVLIVNYKNISHAIYPGGNSTDFKSINITLAVISYEDYRSLHSVSKSIDVALYAPYSPLWDVNMILMIVLSTALVVVGAGWVAYDEWYLSKVSRQRVLESHDSQGNDEDNQTKNSGNEITIFTIIIYFILVCCTILLLYFFYNYMIYFFIGIFCIVGVHSLYHCLQPLWSWFLPVTYDMPLDKLPCIETKVKLRNILLLLLCATIVVFWAIERHANYAWILQDILGAAFCIFFIYTLRLPNLKIISIFVLMLLIYDVFFVFITPLFTKDGISIMESVATGDHGRSKETIPMIFLLPYLSDVPVRKCMRQRFSLLGFGDVVVPGLLVAYNATFDVKTGSKMVYYICSSVGYLIGMIICYISLLYMNSGQPALLYLIPGTLFTTTIVALIRKESHQIFFGQNEQKPKNTENIETTIRECEDVNMNNDCIYEEEKNLMK